MGGDPGVVGRSITIDGVPVTVIGVMPEGFTQPAPTDVWMPFDLPPNVRSAVTGGRIVAIFGRLADGVTRQAADREADEFTRRTLEAFPDNRDFSYRAQTFREQLLNNADNTVLLVQGAAAVLLLLASINLMSLLVAWGFERRQEMAVRLALGGGTGRVVKLLVTQGALIVGAGLVVGLVIARVLLLGVRQLDLGPQLGFFLSQARLDGPLVLACIPAAALLAVVSGVVPAVLNRRTGLAQALRSSSRSVSQSVAALRVQRLLVVAQAAFSVVVLASATALGVSFRKLSLIPDGFEPSGRVVARIVLPDDRYRPHALRVAFGDALSDALAREPGLTSHGFTSTLPVGDLRRGGRFFIPDASGTVSNDPFLLHFRRVSPEYLRVMGMSLLRGRHFTAADDSASPAVAIVSRAAADRYWQGRDPIGQRIQRVQAGGAPQDAEVVGVVEDAMDGGYEATRGEAVYMPFAQVSLTSITIVAQSTNPGEGLAAIRRSLAATDPLIAATGTATLERLVATANVLPQLRALMLMVFAVASIAIAALGSYGVMRQLVANREREFALRLVFGAVPRDLAREVLVQVARLAIPGIVVGLVGAWFCASLLRAFMFGVDPRSGVVLAVVALSVLALAVVTALPTVVRAMRIDVRSGTVT
jgi:predicted permease